jgi:hypothetical protein
MNILKGYAVQIKRNRVLRVTRVLPLDVNEDEFNVVISLRRNEWAGAGRPPYSKHALSIGGGFLVSELDVILFLAAITCDMPQRDKIMIRGGTTRVVGCACCLCEMISHMTR